MLNCSKEIAEGFSVFAEKAEILSKMKKTAPVFEKVESTF